MKIFGKKVEKVTIPNKLVSSLCYIIKITYGRTVITEQIMKAHALQDNSTTGYIMVKKHTEIHPDHPSVKVHSKRQRQTKWQGCENLVVLLVKATLLSPGFSLEDPKPTSTEWS